MSTLDFFIERLYKVILDKPPRSNQTLIKYHTKFLEEVGDLSFPVLMKNWFTILETTPEDLQENILHYKFTEPDIESALNKIKTVLEESVKIHSFKIINNHIHIFLHRSFVFMKHLIPVLSEKELYGSCNLFQKHIEVVTYEELDDIDLTSANLSVLRLFIIKKVLENLLKLMSGVKLGDSSKIYLGFNRKQKDPHITCGPVVNEKGVKNSTHSAADLFNKRASDMRMMAQHRYRLSIKPNTGYNDYFYKIGVSSVTIELLSNKPHKPIKVILNGMSNVNKGPSFIFYNCARLCVLLNKFQRKVNEKTYPNLPDVGNIDFTLLNQPEEWELFFVYILQFPNVVRNCIRDIEKGILNLQNLITYLANMSSVFSVYYRRVRILTDPREHMFSLVHARIYLLKALQCVFHNALRILNIEPIKEM